VITYLLDTNICIYVIKRCPPQVLERFRQSDVSSIGISSITYSELTFGAAKSTRPEQNRIALTQFVAPLEIAPYETRLPSSTGIFGPAWNAGERSLALWTCLSPPTPWRLIASW